MPMEPEVPMGEKSISARAQHSACTTTDARYLYLFGGYDGFKPMSDLWLLDLQTQVLRSISIETPAPEARARHTAHMVASEKGDLLHLFGGYDGAKPIGVALLIECGLHRIRIMVPLQFKLI